MKKRSVGGGAARSNTGTAARTPLSSNTSNAHSSTSTSGSTSVVEVEDEVNKLSIASLTLDVPIIPLRKPRRVPATPFHFLSLPSELRLKIYNYYFDEDDKVLDLDPGNHKRVHKRLVLMRVCWQLHDEATHYFYSTRRFRIFPTYPGRYFKTKKPLLSRMKQVQRENINSLELRVGPGFNAPPRGWTVNEALGLKECLNCEKLVVFVECDPSDSIFKGFRRSEGFYELFCRNLLSDVLSELPSVRIIEFDAWSSVKKSGGMMQGLLEVAGQSGRLISWGPERGWTDDAEDDNTKRASGSVADVTLLGGVSIAGYASQGNILAVA